MIEKLGQPIDLGLILKYASIFIPGLSFLIYSFYFLGRLEIVLPIQNTQLLNYLLNSYITPIVFLLVIFGIGSYIYLFALRVYSYFFSRIFPGGMDDQNPVHNYWRHFSISTGFSVVLIFGIELLYILFSKDPFLGLLFLIVLITSYLTYLMHSDIKIKNSEKKDDNWKSFNWDESSITRKYYSYEGLMAIVNDLQRRVKQITK